jgi:hypothetical protein
MIFNSIRCWLIWRRLKSSLPPHGKRFVEFVPDPVGGTVGFSYRPATLDLLRVASIAEASMLLPMKLPRLAADEGGLQASWMRLLGQHLEPAFIIATRSQRTIVDFSFRTEPLPLKIDWQSFCYLALGLGISIHETGFSSMRDSTSHELWYLQKPIRLLDGFGKPVILVRSEENSFVATIVGDPSVFSLRRAFAQELVMLISHDGKLESIPLLATGKIAHNPFEFFDHSDRLAIAMRWTMYAETVNEYQREIIPATQFWLKLQQDCVLDLRRMPDLRERLVDRVFKGQTQLALQVLRSLDQWYGHIIEAEKLLENPAQILQRTPLIADLWSKLNKSGEVFRLLWSQFQPLASATAVKTVDLMDLSTDAAVLARIIIANSVLSLTPRAGWSTQVNPRLGTTELLIPPNPIEKLLRSKEGNLLQKEIVLR